MSLHVFGAVITAQGLAANNRGETEGNITTLQKILWDNQVHTTVSAEAIRWALRYLWQKSGLLVNRKWDENKDEHEWQDDNWLYWTDPDGRDKDEKPFIDDDVLGFMLAEAAKLEGNDTLDAAKKEKKEIDAKLKSMSKEEKNSDEGKDLKRQQKDLGARIKVLGKGTCNKRRGVLEITRAISTTPYAGDITFNARSGKKDSTSLYGTETHATRYQYGFAFTPERLAVKEYALNIIDAIVNISNVGGNHSRFLFDFSPESIVLRITDDPAPRLLYCFEEDEAGGISVPKLINKVKVGDIDPKELYIGGLIAGIEELKELKVNTLEPGIKNTAKKLKEDLKAKLDTEAGTQGV